MAHCVKNLVCLLFNPKKSLQIGQLSVIATTTPNDRRLLTQNFQESHTRVGRSLGGERREGEKG